MDNERPGHVSRLRLGGACTRRHEGTDRRCVHHLRRAEWLATTSAPVGSHGAGETIISGDCIDGDSEGFDYHALAWG